MFGTLFSAIGKVFTPVTNAVARVGSAVFGVGSLASTAGAATGAASMASGGLSGFLGSGGVLSNILQGALVQAGIGAAVGAATGALTGIGAGKGAAFGAVGGAITGGISGAARGLAPAQTPSGMSPSGQTSAPRGLGPGTGTNSAGFRTQPAVMQGSTVVQPQQPPSSGGLFTNLFRGEQGGALLKGLGEGLMTGMAVRDQNKAQMARLEREIQYKEDEEQRRRDSYSVDPSVNHKPLNNRGNSNQSPAQRFSRGLRYRFDPGQGMIVTG